MCEHFLLLGTFIKIILLFWKGVSRGWAKCFASLALLWLLVRVSRACAAIFFILFFSFVFFGSKKYANTKTNTL